MIDFNTKVGRVAKKYLKSEYFIWLTTVDSTGTPRPRPVWFIWQDDSILIFSRANAYKVKHIRKNPKVALHFNTEDVAGDKRVMIFAGEAVIDEKCPPAHKVAAYLKKYRSGIANLEIKTTPEEFGRDYSVAIRISPTQVQSWG